jgi:hypothetical protein
MATKKAPRQSLFTLLLTMFSRNTVFLVCYVVGCTITLLMGSTEAFVAPSSAITSSRRRFDFAPTRLELMDATNAFQDAATILSSSPSSVLLAETDPWVQPLALVLDPALNLLSFAMVRSYMLKGRGPMM